MMRVRPIALAENQNGKLQSGFPAVNPDNSWRLAAPFMLHRVDTMRQLTHKPESGAAAFWRWASTKHVNFKRVAWQGGEPPFRFSVYKDDVLEGESTWVRTQSLVNPLMYNHTYPSYAYEHDFQPDISENGTTINYKYLVESQDGQALVIRAPTQVDNSRFKYFAPAPAGSNANAGTFEAPYETFGHGYASVVNAQNYIYCYKAGTYSVNNGTPGNDAAFNSTHCKSHVGIESGVIINCDGGSFTGNTDDIYVSNVTITGGNPAMQSGNVRQFNFGGRVNRAHFHRVVGDTNVVGNVGGDNPACIFFPDFGGGNFHEDIVFTDCTQPATAKTQFAVLFQVQNFLIENLVSLSPALPSSNGPLAFGLKDGVKNGTVRHCDIVASTPNLLTHFYSQDWANCGNLDMHYCRLVNLNASSTATISFNDQVDSAPKEKPIDYWIQKCSIDANNGNPFSFKNFTGLGYPVNYTGVLWESTASTIDGGTTGGASIGTSSAKVADINTVSSGDLGLRGHVISSTLVT